ncbi:MAG TPA: methylmalonyl-CoA mutase family protein [Nocardioides sp.]|uniref:methylmalonyl-CoA mutase family protein n=1 Tax=Nocardioides sp. TaxID=35761 RepID=UPI002F4220E2
MTDEVAGGLEEPEELQPEQGALRLAAPEDDATRADWEKAAAAVLRKGGRLTDDDSDDAVWAALTRTTYDGIPVPPLGTPDLLDDLVTSGRPTRTGDWDIRVPLHEPDGTALPDLENGATSLWLVSGRLADQLEGVMLDLAPVVLENGTPSTARRLLEIAAERGIRLHPDSNLGADPLGTRVRGDSHSGSDEGMVEIARLALEHGVRGVVVDATSAHDLGASDAQEVGYSLAAGATYLRMLTAAGMTVDEAAGLLEFRYAATDEQFPTIAKLRAARRCWARLLGLSGASGEQRQHAVTSRAMLSAYDPWVNMLRGTVAAFAAGVGGAEAVTVVPFDSPLGEPDAFGRRIARNVSSLLLAESHVGAVTDPAGGAYAVEKLTDDLATAAWAELQRIEGVGGIGAALEDGSFLGRVEGVAATRARDVATRAKPITGLSEFPHLGETLPERVGRPDQVRRWGAAFEALRADPPAQHVFLATLGPVAQHTARASFAANLLAAGGIPVDVAGATEGVEDVVTAYQGQRVVCLAGSDTAYDAWGRDAAEALRGAGATRVIVVVTDAPAWADDSCAAGVDAVEFLTRTREALR